MYRICILILWGLIFGHITHFKMSEDESTKPSPGKTSMSDTDSSQNIRPKVKIELPPIFTGDGTEDFGQWCRRFEVAVNASAGYDLSELASILPVRLGGNAFGYWDSLEDSVKDDYDAVKTLMKKVFRKREFIATFQTYINARPRYPNEPLEVYQAELTRLVNEAFPKYDKVAKEGETFRRFVAGLEPQLQLKIHEFGATDLATALSVAVRIERAQMASRIQAPHNHTSSSTTNLGKLGTDEVSELRKSIDTLVHKVDRLELELNRAKQHIHEPYQLRSYDYSRPYADRDSVGRSRSPYRYRSFSPYRRDSSTREPLRSSSPYRSPSRSPSRSRERYRDDRNFSRISYHSPSRNHGKYRDDRNFSQSRSETSPSRWYRSNPGRNGSPSTRYRSPSPYKVTRSRAVHFSHQEN